VHACVHARSHTGWLAMATTCLGSNHSCSKHQLLTGCPSSKAVALLTTALDPAVNPATNLLSRWHSGLGLLAVNCQLRTGHKADTLEAESNAGPRRLHIALLQSPMNIKLPLHDKARLRVFASPVWCHNRHATKSIVSKSIVCKSTVTKSTGKLPMAPRLR